MPTMLRASVTAAWIIQTRCVAELKNDFPQATEAFLLPMAGTRLYTVLAFVLPMLLPMLLLAPLAL